MRLLAMNNRPFPIDSTTYSQVHIYIYIYSLKLYDSLMACGKVYVWLCGMVWRFNTTHFHLILLFLLSFKSSLYIVSLLHNRLSLARNLEKWLLGCKLFSRFPERTNPVSSEIHRKSIPIPENNIHTLFMYRFYWKQMQRTLWNLMERSVNKTNSMLEIVTKRHKLYG